MHAEWQREHVACIALCSAASCKMGSVWLLTHTTGQQASRACFLDICLSARPRTRRHGRCTIGMHGCITRASCRAELANWMMTFNAVTTPRTLLLLLGLGLGLGRNEACSPWHQIRRRLVLLAEGVGKLAQVVDLDVGPAGRDTARTHAGRRARMPLGLAQRPHPQGPERRRACHAACTPPCSRASAPAVSMRLTS